MLPEPVADPASALIEVSNLSKHFAIGGGLLGRQAQKVRAVEDVSFTVRKGEVLGLVGESGSGKSTIGPDHASPAGAYGREHRPSPARRSHGWAAASCKPLRRRMQLVFQDPFGSLNPRMTVGRIVAAPLIIHERRISGAERARCGSSGRCTGSASPPRYLNRYPHEFSGGQRQRIGIARALIIEPDFLVADEPVSALDVSIQAQIVNLLLAIKAELGLTILFITHDLAVVGHISDRVAVMYLGRLVELAPVRDALPQAAPPLHRGASLRRSRSRTRPSAASASCSRAICRAPSTPPSGCAFRTRCPYALPACAERVPELRDVGRGHLKACIRDELELRPAPVAA